MGLKTGPIDTPISESDALKKVKNLSNEYIGIGQWDRLTEPQKQFILDSLINSLTGSKPPGLAEIRKIREKMGLPTSPSNAADGARQINASWTY